MKNRRSKSARGLREHERTERFVMKDERFSEDQRSFEAFQYTPQPQCYSLDPVYEMNDISSVPWLCN